MALFIYANFYSAQLASTASSASTVFTVSSITDLPTSIPNGFYLALTLQSAGTPSIREIVYATSISGSNITVIRAQENTGAQNWAVGDYIYADATGGTLGALAWTNGSTTQSFAASNLYAATGVLSNIATFSPTEAYVNGSIIAWTNGTSWTLPAGIQRIEAEIGGGGGGGGGAAGTTARGGAGGGGAGYALGVYTVTGGNGLTITVGAGGTGGGAGGGNGTAGGTTTVGALLTVSGGGGGGGNGGAYGTPGMVVEATLCFLVVVEGFLMPSRVVILAARAARPTRARRAVRTPYRPEYLVSIQDAAVVARPPMLPVGMEPPAW